MPPLESKVLLQGFTDTTETGDFLQAVCPVLAMHAEFLVSNS